jgi:chitinase
VENGETVEITVELDKAPGDGNEARVNYVTVSGTATAGSDYIATNGTLTFGPTETSQTFSVTILDDSDEEGTETASLALSSPDGCVLANINNPASLRITDDDYVARTIDFSQSTYSVSETDSSATITVLLDAAPGPGYSVTVDYATADGTATAGADYTAASGTLTFGEADIQQTFTVFLTDDSAVEDTETVVLTLNNPSNGVLAAKANHPATLAIEDDDAPIVGFTGTTYTVDEDDGSVEITVELDKAPGPGVTAFVDYYSFGGTATAGEDYTAVSDTLAFGPTESSKSFTVPIINDQTYEGTETIRVHLTNPSFCTLDEGRKLANIVVADDEEPGSVTGDANNDGFVDAIDVQLCVNAALGHNVGTATTDQNSDGKTDAVDIQIVINAVLGI